jgi:hypothetical protein
MTCFEGMGKNTIFDSFHNYDRLAIQPFFDQTVLNVEDSLLEISKFYNVLEEYFKLKLDIPANINNFD